MRIGRKALRILAPLGLLMAAAADGPSEYQVKAAFLLNFARFVEWPKANSGPLVIGVFGADPLWRNAGTGGGGETGE
jgi:hypothetical protein